MTKPLTMLQLRRLREIAEIERAIFGQFDTCSSTVTAHQSAIKDALRHHAFTVIGGTYND